MKPATQRLAYLDWVRGLAAIVMLQGHVFDSFIRKDLRDGGPFTVSQFVGGMPPAVFLFLLGVTFAFLMDSQERKQIQPLARWGSAIKRAGFLFAAAFLFRLQLWAFAFGKSPWTDLFKVDILNCMGLAILILSIMAVFKTTERIRLCAILGFAIAAAGPLVSGLDSPAVPALLHGYFIPDHASFGFFPWAAFVAFGMSAGSVLRIVKSEDVSVAMQWFAWGGSAVAFGAYSLSFLPASIYPNSDFWLNHPALILIKLGVVLMLVSFAWLWNLQMPEGSFSWVRQMGLASLLVYWVHVELIYGSAFWILKDSLTVGQTAIAAVLTIFLMLGLSLLKTNWATVRTYMSAQTADTNRSEASGD